jgi:glycosyltransferase involved in cell wall biosynthesis
MNISILTTYPPRQCGIASFSSDLRKNMMLYNKNIYIVSLSDNSYDYPNEVIFDLRQDSREDYKRAAQFINKEDIDVVILQHEYGIFGGQDGDFVLDFTKNLKKPFILCTHTILDSPNENQCNILKILGQQAFAVIAMTNKSKELLNRIYKIPLEKTHVIWHGVPVFEKTGYEAKKDYGIAERPLVTTFGFVGPGKGIEIGIKAISKLRHKYPDIIYFVVGETHPSLKKTMGESYRESLLQLVEELDMENNIRFINSFVSIQELGRILYMTDVYLTPYPNRNQAVSGTLSFAIGCGRAIVSTPYDYSLELLANNRGLVASKADPNELAALIDSILSSPKLKSELEKNAQKLGAKMSWPNVAKNYIHIIEKSGSDLRDDDTCINTL